MIKAIHLSETLTMLSMENGGGVLFDRSYLHFVETLKWRWSSRFGVISTTGNGNTRVLFHSMIAPYKRISFKNGLKWDCRRENLIDFNKGGVLKGKNIHWNEPYKRFSINRGLSSYGQKFSYSTCVAVTSKRSKDQALEKALEIHKFLFSMERDEFLTWVKNRPYRKVKCSEVISEWDYLKEHGTISNAEMYQMNMNHFYQEKD